MQVRTVPCKARLSCPEGPPDTVNAMPLLHSCTLRSSEVWETQNGCCCCCWRNCCCCCRLGASELHVVASVMGGMAAQEAIKLLTGQFVPFRCVCVWGGGMGHNTVMRAVQRKCAMWATVTVYCTV